ncbi:NADPH-dependent FMN reductase [Streptomyces globisporus]|uniref:NADPH-dependent oxidoreductase n=1 Tax=Streptomyces globisporus TaxID=1908 RepID=A0A068EFD2_STRGL|nr:MULTISPECIES: NAD(P)H-dependent oxidoreductase [Streptomyces]AID47019.1 putative reductase [Streptomyces globisporus]ROV69900.1 NADPH-dependent oxidoreductase [Streptomyces globisporus]
MPAQSPRLAVMVASARPGGAGQTVAKWFLGQAEEHGYSDVDVISLAEAALPVVTGGPADDPWPPAVADLGRRVDAAEGFVVVTPEHNHSFPALLKNAVDWYRREWYAKPVAFVSYGGISGGLRAVEQLRLVFAELHAPTMRDSVSFHRVWEQFDEAGRPGDPVGCGHAAKTMLDQLDWWTRSLTEARAKRPYTS